MPKTEKENAAQKECGCSAAATRVGDNGVGFVQSVAKSGTTTTPTLLTGKCLCVCSIYF